MKKKRRRGPPLHGSEPKVTTSLCVSREVKEYLDQCEQSQSIVVEAAVRRTKEFKEWTSTTATAD